MEKPAMHRYEYTIYMTDGTEHSFISFGFFRDAEDAARAFITRSFRILQKIDGEKCTVLNIDHVVRFTVKPVEENKNES